MSLRERTFSAVRWTTGGTIARALLQLSQIAVLARILAPEDYGLIAMVTVVLSFAVLFADLGVNSAFVQRRDVSQAQRSSLFWLNVVVSTALMLLVVVLSPLLAGFFGDERLTPLLMLSAGTFVISALGVQVRMAAEKALRFRLVMLIEVAAALIGFAAALAAALHDWGVYALVAGSIVGAVASTGFAWMFLAEGWRPAWRLRFEDVRTFLGFGGALVANNVVNQVNMTVDLFLGGRMLTATQLGLYSVPRNLTLQAQFAINPIVTRVAFPLISEVQLDIARVRAIYLQTINMSASTNGPVYVGMAFFAPEIVAVLLGSGWDRAGVILQILALWGGLRSIGNPVGSLLLGMGRADLSLKWNLGMLLLVVPVVWYGSNFGPEGIAWALVGLAVALFVPGWFVLVRPLCRAGLREYSIAALRPFGIATCAVAPAFLVADLFDSSMLRLVVGAVVSAPLYLGLSYILNRRWVVSMWELVGGKGGPG